MKTNKWFKFGLVTLSILMLGAMAFTSIDGTVFADDSDPEDPEVELPYSGFGPGQDHPMRERAAGAMRYGRETMLASLAEQSGIAVEDLENARDNDSNINALLSEAGFSDEDIAEMMLNAQYAAVDQAVEDGHLTAEEAVERKAQLEALPEARAEWQANRESYQAKWLELLAEETGYTVEELEASREAGTPVHELLEESMDTEEVRALFEETRQELVDQAIAEGLITAEQAENMQNRTERNNQNKRFNEGMNETFGDDWQEKLREHYKENNGERPERNSDSSFDRGGRGFGNNSADS